MVHEYTILSDFDPLTKEQVIKAKLEIERNHPLVDTPLEIAYPYLIGKVFFFFYGLFHTED